MKKTLFVAILLITGCASPAADYVRADKATWDQYDTITPSGKPLIDAWVDSEASFSADKKDAFHQLNTARRARVDHAIAAVGT